MPIKSYLMCLCLVCLGRAAERTAPYVAVSRICLILSHPVLPSLLPGMPFWTLALHQDTTPRGMSRSASCLPSKRQPASNCGVLEEEVVDESAAEYVSPGPR
ncbi:hypothetical protein F4780DRAFT_723350 [Xylariomycetidae sp. FL0641]|nr:hypothetical protein F4780DRAFT_723350 [Xylariomycetidae sp. FL0641]